MRRSCGCAERAVVSVLTPSIPERAGMLRECERSVAAQTVSFWEHLVTVDEAGEGCSVTMNRLAAEAQGVWVMPLADDDLLLPGGIAALLMDAVGADVVYAPPLVTGNEDRWWFFQEPPVIPATALIRADLWREIGGYDESLLREEDRDLWVKAVAAGAKFRRVDEPVWIYRQHGANKSFASAA